LRERKSNESRALAVLVYHLGLSYRNARATLSAFEIFSHKAVRKWYDKMSHLFPEPKRKERRAIAVNETKIKVKYKWNYV
jgi:transposase-like protein